MLKKIVIATVIAATAIELTGCTPGNNVPGSTAVGAIAGGLIGNELFHGQNAFAGVIAGALIGGMIGNKVGEYMDKQDRANMESAIIHTPVNQEATWTSDRPGPGGQPITYTVRPVKVYHQKNQYCREYQTTVVVEGRSQQAYGKACRKPHGQWKIMS